MGWLTREPRTRSDGGETLHCYGAGGPRMTATQEHLDSDTLTGVVAHDISHDTFPVSGWDALVWASGNATQSALYFQLAFGMRLEAYSGPETGNRDHHAYVLRAGSVRFVIKGAVIPDS